MTEYQPEQLRNIVEAALLVATRPMSVSQLESVFEHEENPPGREAIIEAIGNLQSEYESRGIELIEVASGWRMQTRESMSPWIANLFQEKAPRYSRALLETLVLIAYRQPITRGEIEDIRGVAVSSNIVRTLIERDWVKIVGHRDVPGRPSLLGTTKQFLDYFNLKKIGELPTLSEIKALDEIAPELAQEVAMLDSTLAPEEEAAELDPVLDEPSAEAGEAESTGAGSQSSAETSEVASAAVEEVEQHTTSDNTEQDVVVAGAETVDVELAPEEEQTAPESESAAVAETEAAEKAEELTANEEPATEEDEVAAVAEATIDAMSAVQRSETELLH